MKTLKIDINVDVGEGIGNEKELFPYASSCNIACGGHTGNHQTMLSTILLAKRFNVKIGAHPSFPDKRNFGRRILKIDNKELLNSLIRQVKSLQIILKKENIKLNHIKAHGGLYNLSSYDKQTAKILIYLAKKFDTKLYVPYSTVISKMAKKEGIKIFNELFMDRNYNSDLTLVSRDSPNAIINNSEKVFQHVNKIINEKKIISIDKKSISVDFDTLCVHGDSPNAVEILKELNLKFKNIGMKFFT